MSLEPFSRRRASAALNWMAEREIISPIGTCCNERFLLQAERERERERYIEQKHIYIYIYLYAYMFVCIYTYVYVQICLYICT